jgi:hypothetical protein
LGLRHVFFVRQQFWEGKDKIDAAHQYNKQLLHTFRRNEQERSERASYVGGGWSPSSAAQQTQDGSYVTANSHLSYQGIAGGERSPSYYSAQSVQSVQSVQSENNRNNGSGNVADGGNADTEIRHDAQDGKVHKEPTWKDPDVEFFPYGEPYDEDFEDYCTEVIDLFREAEKAYEQEQSYAFQKPEPFAHPYWETGYPQGNPGNPLSGSNQTPLYNPQHQYAQHQMGQYQGQYQGQNAQMNAQYGARSQMGYFDAPPSYAQHAAQAWGTRQLSPLATVFTPTKQTTQDSSVHGSPSPMDHNNIAQNIIAQNYAQNQNLQRNLQPGHVNQIMVQGGQVPAGPRGRSEHPSPGSWPGRGLYAARGRGGIQGGGLAFQTPRGYRGHAMQAGLFGESNTFAQGNASTQGNSPATGEEEQVILDRQNPQNMWPYEFHLPPVSAVDGLGGVFTPAYNELQLGQVEVPRQTDVVTEPTWPLDLVRSPQASKPPFWEETDSEVYRTHRMSPSSGYVQKPLSKGKDKADDVDESNMDTPRAFNAGAFRQGPVYHGPELLSPAPGSSASQSPTHRASMRPPPGLPIPSSLHAHPTVTASGSPIQQYVAQSFYMPPPNLTPRQRSSAFPQLTINTQVSEAIATHTPPNPAAYPTPQYTGPAHIGNSFSDFRNASQKYHQNPFALPYGIPAPDVGVNVSVTSPPVNDHLTYHAFPGSNGIDQGYDIYFRGIHASRTPIAISGLFSSFGIVIRVTISKVNGGYSEGMVRMHTLKSAEAAIQGLNGKDVEGNVLQVIDIASLVASESAATPGSQTISTPPVASSGATPPLRNQTPEIRIEGSNKVPQVYSPTIRRPTPANLKEPTPLLPPISPKVAPPPSPPVASASPQQGLLSVPGNRSPSPMRLTPPSGGEGQSSAAAPKQDVLPVANSVVGSWARIASAGSSSKTYNLANQNKPNASNSTPMIPRLNPTGRIPSVENIRASYIAEPQIAQARVVFILNIPPSITLQHISDAISNGPIHSINFGNDQITGGRFAGIIFLYASEAELCFKALERQRTSDHPNPRLWPFTGYSEVTAMRGDPYPADDMIRSMYPPTNARRRITIVKSGLFSQWGKNSLQALCNKIVGEDKVQLVFTYNSGNGTVVFADVESAEKVKEKLESMTTNSKKFGATFEGMIVSYSKDPNEAPLRLVSAMR